jgi:hypothetical protein
MIRSHSRSLFKGRLTADRGTATREGQREENLVDIAKLLAARRRDPLRIEGVSNPADPDSDLNETGVLLPGPDATLAGPTCDEWPDSTS